MLKVIAFSAKLLACVVLGFLLVFASISVVWLYFPSCYEDSFQKGLLLQYRALEKSDPNERKIIVLGDSSMAFSVDSAQLSALTGLPCYTFGVHAGIGEEYIYEEASKFVREGDIVVAPFTNYSAGYYGTDLILFTTENEPELYFEYVLAHPLELFKRGSERAAVKFYYCLTGAPDVTGTYSHSSFDEVGNISLARKTIVSKAYSDAKAKTVYKPGFFSEETIAFVNDFYAECAEKGATFLLTSPPVYENNIGSTQEELEAFDAWARSVFDAPIICEKWSDGFVAYEDLYDGVRHLNSAGASAYTQNLYEDLLPYLT